MRPKERPERSRLARLAAQQHGVISIRQLRALGYSPGAVKHAVRGERLHRLHRGVYADHLGLSPYGHHLAAVLACAPEALLSHGSAAWLWGLWRQPPARIHVTAPTRRHPQAGLRLHHAALVAEDRALRENIPVTSLARTLLDLADAYPARLERALERSEELGLFDLRKVDALLGRLPHHRGAAPLRRALELYRPDRAFTRSGLERRFRQLVREAGLPLPAANAFVEGYELDAYWEAERFAVELDVFETHGSRAAFERDRLRQEELKLAGIEMSRITGPRLRREPHRVMERLALLLERRRAELR